MPEKKKEKTAESDISVTPNDEKSEKSDKSSRFDKSKAKSDTPKSRGFNHRRRLKPEKIVAVTDSIGEPTFLMKWRGTDETNLVRCSDASQKCPQLVIDFYEKHSTWITQTNDH